MDDYTEVLEEIYEKYRDRGGKLAPEIRLLFMIIMSGVTYHLSQALFGSDGLNSAIQNNPNVLHKLLGAFMNGKNKKNNDAEPMEARDTPHNDKDILAAIKKHNQSKKSEPITSEASARNSEKRDNATLAIEREKRLLAEQRAAYETQLRKQNEMYTTQLEQMKNITTPIKQTVENIDKKTNQILSDANSRPRFRDNPLLSINKQSDFSPAKDFNIFESEIKDSDKASVIQPLIKNSPKKQSNFNELMESLENSTDDDLDEIIETSSKKKNKIPISVSKPPASIKKPTNSIIRSASRKRTETGSDVAGKRNIIKL